MTDAPDAFDIASLLDATGQSHLLDGLDQLEPAARDAYLTRLAAIDWDELAHEADHTVTGEVGPSRVLTLAERQERHAELVEAGEAAYRAGRVAVLMVAGGQGTRLGFNGPKGCFQAGAHSGKSIYQLQAEKVASLSQRVGQAVPFLVLTSPMTDLDTRAYFAAHDDFGLVEGQVRFFSQGTVPSLDQDGRALLAEPGRLLENPDGHGGCFTALVGSGRLAELVAEGIEQLVYIQVDNVLAPVDDPELVGVATVESTEVVTKVLEKAHPDEKVGHLVRVGASDRIIEYTELTPEQTRETSPTGELIYRWGSPAMHCWSIAFLDRLGQAGFKPPLHRSAKPLKAWVDGGVHEVQGWKNERFIFDLVPQATVSVGLAIERDDEFAPIKNASGTDSVDSMQALCSAAYGRWLEAAGVSVELAEGQTIEISPLFAATAAQFAAEWDGRTASISGDYYLER